MGIKELEEKRNLLYSDIVSSGVNLTEKQWELVFQYVKVSIDLLSLSKTSNSNFDISDLKRRKIGEGSQSNVYLTLNDDVYKEFKPNTEHPFDFMALKKMVENIKNLKRVNIPFRLIYGKENEIIGELEKYIPKETIELSNLPCALVFKWYKEASEDMKILSQNKISTFDISTDNMVINSNGMFIIDVGCFEYTPEKTVDEIQKLNQDNLNFTILYGLIWKVGQFATQQSFEEIFNEIKNFDGTLFQYVQFKNPYDYADKHKNSMK